ncbi:hypothetical protein KAR91_20130 [Candidatus Pacearchaeota archaeon]|nr:hypothetical protein [Candidatus Pacearchaeota archaeon]
MANNFMSFRTSDRAAKTKLRGAIRFAKIELRRRKPELFRLHQKVLEPLLNQSYLDRAAGGTGLGLNWAPLDAEYLAWKRREGLDSRIGMVTGLLFRSLRFDIVGGQLRISYSAPYAQDFNRLRPLLPQKGLPDSVKRRLERVTEQWAEKVVQDAFHRSGVSPRRGKRVII